MLSNSSLKKVHRTGRPGQAIVEFAIVLPILMVLLVGILEVGRMIFIYSVVNNASREAARFGSAVGLGDDGYHKYRYCAGIKDQVERSAYFIDAADLNIDIRYDKGPDDPTAWSSLPQCDAVSGEDTDITLDDDGIQYRIVVSVSAPYSPMVTLIPIPSRSFDSLSARTIIGYVNLDSGSSSISGPGPAGVGVGGGATDTPTATPTSTPTFTPIPPTNTSTATATPTATLAAVYTFTPTGTATGTPATDTPTATPTFTPTNTATATPTFTPTFTPTSTPTVVPGCDQITTSTISVPDISSPKTMSMTITNPHTSITTSSIVVTWNPVGGPGGANLVLLSASLGNTTFWSNVGNGTGTATIATTQIIPGNNATTKILFTFAKNYQVTTGTPPTITINLSTVGCESIQIKNK